jgi:hypothetical protein
MVRPIIPNRPNFSHMATSASEIVTADLLLWSKYLNGWEDNVIGKIFVLYMKIIGANLRAAEIFL